MRSQKMQDFIDDRLDAAMCERLASMTAADIMETEVIVDGRRMDIRDLLYSHFEDRVIEELAETYRDMTGLTGDRDEP